MNTEIEKNQRSITLPDTHANERLDSVLAKLMPEYSRTQISEWIDSGNILLNGKLVKGKMKIKGGEIVSVNAVLKQQAQQWEAQDIPCRLNMKMNPC